VSGLEPGDYGTPGPVDVEVATVRAIYEAFGRRDVEAALEHVADDCVLDVPGTSERTGRSDPYVGPDGVRQYFADAERAWTALTLHADDIRAAANGVVVFGHIEAQVEGRTIERRVVWLWQMRDGKAVRVTANDLGGVPDPA
jgi:ketosteroid isomerase-like protein